MKSISKKLTKVLSLVLVLTTFICIFALPGYAVLPGEEDVISSFRWKTGPYYSKYYSIYRFVLSPEYTERSDVVIFDKEHGDRELTENEEYTVCTEEIPDYGTCFVITLVTDGAKPYLKSGSFKKNDGKCNAAIYLLQNFRYIEANVALFDKEIKLVGNVLEADESLTVSFGTTGCVAVNDVIVAENVRQYTWEPDESGEYKITLSVCGLTVGEYIITAMTSTEIKEERAAELRSSLPEIALNFFKSIPIAIIMLPTLPLIFFGWMPAILAAGPIEYAGQFFDALSEIRQLKA